MRLLTLLMLIAFSTSSFASEPNDRVMIYLLDPRGAIDGTQTLSTEWGGGKADILGSRTLNVTEAKALRKLLAAELVDDDNVPFCGHSPAYAVAVTPQGGATITVTLCATCGTWAKAGKLRALHGNLALEYLVELLSLPDVFKIAEEKPAKTPDPLGSSRKVPFWLLEKPSDE